jgi:excisionase family DNA binding protein
MRQKEAIMDNNTSDGEVIWLQGSAQRSLRLLLTVEEAGRRLSISKSTMYTLIMQKRVFSIKIGGARRIPVKALEEYVDSLIRLQRAG